MHAEVQATVNFLLGFLYNHVPRRKVDAFGWELQRCFTDRFSGHWHADTPMRGSALRCVKISLSENIVDPALMQAAGDACVNISELFEALPRDIIIWVDPGEVTYMSKERGELVSIYSSRNGRSTTTFAATTTKNPSRCTSEGSESDSTDSAEFNFSPTSPMSFQESLPPPSSGSAPTTPQQLLNPPSSNNSNSKPATASTNGALIFTTAEFAQTKFGSTKLKTQKTAHQHHQNHQHRRGNSGNTNTNPPFPLQQNGVVESGQQHYQSQGSMIQQNHHHFRHQLITTNNNNNNNNIFKGTNSNSHHPFLPPPPNSEALSKFYPGTNHHHHQQQMVGGDSPWFNNSSNNSSDYHQQRNSASSSSPGSGSGSGPSQIFFDELPPKEGGNEMKPATTMWTMTKRSPPSITSSSTSTASASPSSSSAANFLSPSLQLQQQHQHQGAPGLGGQTGQMAGPLRQTLQQHSSSAPENERGENQSIFSSPFPPSASRYHHPPPPSHLLSGNHLC